MTQHTVCACFLLVMWPVMYVVNYLRWQKWRITVTTHILANSDRPIACRYRHVYIGWIIRHKSNELNTLPACLVNSPTHSLSRAACGVLQVIREKTRPWVCARPPQSQRKAHIRSESFSVSVPASLSDLNSVQYMCTLTLSRSNSSNGIGSWSTWSLLSPRANGGGSDLRANPCASSNLRWQHNFRSK